MENPKKIIKHDATERFKVGTAYRFLNPNNAKNIKVLSSDKLEELDMLCFTEDFSEKIPIFKKMHTINLVTSQPILTILEVRDYSECNNFKHICFKALIEGNICIIFWHLEYNNFKDWFEEII